MRMLTSTPPHHHSPDLAADNDLGAESWSMGEAAPPFIERRTPLSSPPNFGLILQCLALYHRCASYYPVTLRTLWTASAQELPKIDVRSPIPWDGNIDRCPNSTFFTLQIRRTIWSIARSDSRLTLTSVVSISAAAAANVDNNGYELMKCRDRDV